MKVFLYAEYQVSVPFSEIDWEAVNPVMQQYPGLKSKTWLSGIGNRSVGGFYEFDSVENAQHYIDEQLVPVAKKLGGNLAVRLFDGDATEAASRGMDSPYWRD